MRLNQTAYVIVFLVFEKDSTVSGKESLGPALCCHALPFLSCWNLFWFHREKWDIIVLNKWSDYLKNNVRQRELIVLLLLHFQLCDSNAFTVLVEMRKCGLTDTETCLKGVAVSIDGGQTVSTKAKKIHLSVLNVACTWLQLPFLLANHSSYKYSFLIFWFQFMFFNNYTQNLQHKKKKVWLVTIRLYSLPLSPTR